MTTPTLLLWTDERISMFSGNCSTAWEAKRMYDAMKKVRDDMQAALAARDAEIASLKAQLAEANGDDWGKTVDYLLTLAPEREPTYDSPEPPEGWEDEEGPHYDTPGGY